jgi:HSP20 family protein
LNPLSPTGGESVPRDLRHPGEMLLSLARAFRQTHWQPSVDAYQTKRGWLLKYELAGVPLEDVELEVSGRTVALRGTRRDVRVDEQQQSFCMEISYNRFERILELPCELSGMSVSTDYRDGMLMVRLNCKEPSE